jgi:hypothetical protein
MADLGLRLLVSRCVNQKQQRHPDLRHVVETLRHWTVVSCLLVWVQSSWLTTLLPPGAVLAFTLWKLALVLIPLYAAKDQALDLA